MEDLLQSQIHESCKLALPNGLKELMSDIAREVLRAQPTKLYQFITGYLSALLVARENLSIASHVCGDICNSVCHPELEDALIDIGLSEEDALKAKEVIEDYFKNGKGKESNLLIKLMKKISVDEQQLPAVQKAVRTAFLRHQANAKIFYEWSSESEEDEVMMAAHHTMQLYQQTHPSPEDYNQKVIKLQAAYRAFGVRRQKCSMGLEPLEVPPSEIQETSGKSIRFDPKMKHTTEELFVSPRSRRGISIASSSSLAGSYLHLPKYRPYTVYNHDSCVEFDDTPEQEHISIDYTANNIQARAIIDSDADDNKEKAISFDEIPHEIVVDGATVDAGDDESVVRNRGFDSLLLESEASIEEMIDGLAGNNSESEGGDAGGEFSDDDLTIEDNMLPSVVKSDIDL